MQHLTQSANFVLFDDERELADLSGQVLGFLFAGLEVLADFVGVVFVGGGHAEREGVETWGHIAAIGIQQEMPAEIEDTGSGIHPIPRRLKQKTLHPLANGNRPLQRPNRRHIHPLPHHRIQQVQLRQIHVTRIPLPQHFVRVDCVFVGEGLREFVAVGAV
jgi:hypothetical protein